MKYTFICPRCGEEWESDSFDDWICDCGYWSTVCSYDDGYGISVNKEQYAVIQQNRDHNIKFHLICEDCGSTYDFFDHQHMRCHCGGLLKLQGNPLGERLKAYRENKGYPQRLMAAELGISQHVYGRIEKGTQVVSSQLQKKILTLIDK